MSDLGFNQLAELALDMRWSWNHATDEVWQQLHPALWKLTRNPWIVLRSASRRQIEFACGEPSFRAKVDALLQAKRLAAQTPAWFQQSYPQSQLNCIAYFSMEFMLSENLPIYSGGLGNVAGDQLKAASDLGVPAVGVGLLYSQGYFRQLIDKDGRQQALYPYNDPGQLPITPLRAPTGEWLRLKIDLPGYPVIVRAWKAQVGRASLYLLDSNDAANVPARRGITSELYGGGPELRLQQELVLGIGGWRLLASLGLKPEVCHLNEGHAAFAVLERAGSFMEETGESFEVALAVTRAGNIFTTHTAVPAGFDRFEPSLIDQYLGKYAETKLRITTSELLALGRESAGDASEYFNMAYLAMRGCGAANGVSRLHGEVSRKIFEPLFHRWPVYEVPVDHITNGVHAPSWDSAAADALWTSACGKDRWLSPTQSMEAGIRQVTDAALWDFRNRTRASLVAYVRERLSQQMSASGLGAQVGDLSQRLLDPDGLTVGFARRFATYKRPNLLLRDKDRLLRLLTNPQRPVQLILAGKAHPADRPGQDLIQQWIEFIRNSPARSHVVFLSDYDMELTEQLVQGVDVWLNTPRRPWEASGTSGMKVLVNGGINLSELDGWWAEAYAPEVGWALGDGNDRGEDAAWDEVEAKQLFDVLENEVVPEFYTRDSAGVPTGWTQRMRESMARLAPQFSTTRSVCEYTERRYVPAAAGYHRRAADGCAAGKKIVDWQRELNDHWHMLRIGAMNVKTIDSQLVFELNVSFGSLDRNAVRVEIYADPIGPGAPDRHEMSCDPNAVSADGAVYRARVPATRPVRDYTARVIPHNPDAMIPLEATSILWRG